MSRYTEAVESGLSGLMYVSMGDEANEFSATSCGICGTYAAGAWHHWTYVFEVAPNITEENDNACADCLNYLGGDGDEPEGWWHITPGDSDEIEAPDDKGVFDHGWNSI